MKKTTKTTEELSAEVEHYKIYWKAWQRARGMIMDEMKERDKVEREAMSTIYHIMTQSINHEVKNIDL